MKRWILLGVGALALSACDAPASRGTGGEGDARQADGEATDLVDSMARRGRLPQRDYTCSLIGGGGDGKTYGTLGVANDRFTLILKGGGRREGSLTVNEDRELIWDGEPVVIDGEARRVSRGRVNSEGQTVELAFDFSPDTEDGHDQVVCVAEA